MTFKIGPIHRSVPHLLADLIELLLIVGYDGMTHIAKQSAEAIIASAEIHPEELDERETEDGDSEADAVKNDRVSIAMEDAWKVLLYRDKFFGEHYPFDIDGNTIRPSNQLTDSGRIYRFLLACSRLRSFDKRSRSAWAKGFASVSAFALKQALPARAIVKVFDANSEDRRSHYSTDLRMALKVLGKELHAYSIHEVECEKAGSSGDAQIDIVANYPFEDGCSGTISVLGQCAARETEWPTKRFEGNPATLVTYFTLTNTPLHVTFIPLSFRLTTGEWVSGNKVTGTLVLDRGRILNLVLVPENCDEIIHAQWFKDFENKLPLTVA